MTRILALDRCAITLRVMADARILDCDAGVLGHLEAYEGIAEAPSLAARLALLVGPGGMDDLKARWRLGNVLVRQAGEIVRAARLVADGHLAEAAYRFPERLETAGDLAAALAGWSRLERDAVRQRLHAYAPPRFPLTGAVLLRHGFAPGPGIGAELSRLEAAWLDSDFTLTRDELLAMAGARKD